MSIQESASFSEFMAENPGEAITEAKVREYLIAKASRDEHFRRALVADPVGTVNAEIGGRLPEDLDVEVHEESHETLHLVLPAPMELTGAELEGVAGGWVGAPISDHDA